MLRSAIVCAAMLIASAATYSADWPQFRGPERNGIAPASPPLVESFTKESLKLLWTSEEIPGGMAGGWAAVAVAGDKAYVYANDNRPTAWRWVTRESLDWKGYSPDIPAELSKKVEDARVGVERKVLKDDKAITAWTDEWIKANLTKEQAPFRSAVSTRLKGGPGAVPIEVLNKVAAVAEQKFDTAQAWAQWVKDSGLDVAGQKAAMGLASPGREPKDWLWALDAATGKTFWKISFAGERFGYPASGTPTIADGKIYLLGSNGCVLCFDAADGKTLWQSEVVGKAGAHHARASSVLLSEGLAIAVTDGGTVALSPADGKVVWKSPGVASEFSSAVAWTKDAKTYLIIASGPFMVDLKDGKKLAQASGQKGNGYNMATLSGDWAVCPHQDGLSACGLSPGKFDPAWSVPLGVEQFAGPIIDGKYVYAMGGGYAEGKETPKGKAMCVELEGGKVMWEESVPMAQHSSPILADGKIIAVAGSELLVFKASPEKFQLIGRADPGLEKWCSPAFADGKVYLRTAKNVVCYDMTKSSGTAK